MVRHSEYYNENTIPGEVVEENDGPAHRGIDYGTPARSREYTGDTPYSTILGRAYAWENARSGIGPIKFELPKTGQTIRGSRIRIEDYYLYARQAGTAGRIIDIVL